MIDRIKTLFKNYSWDFHLWSMKITGDTKLDEVKRQLPAYITVDWHNPVQVGKGILYPVTWIKGHKMKRKQYLGFVEGVYCGCTLMC